MTKKILYLSPYFWPEEIGSAPYSTELAVWLQAQGRDIKTVAFRPHYPSPEPFGEWAEGARDTEVHKSVEINRVAVGDRGTGGFKDRLKNDIAFFFHVCKRAFRKEYKDTDVIIAYVPTILTLFAARFVKLFTGAKIVSVVHDIESGLAGSLGMVKNKTALFVMRLVERIGLNFCTQVIVLTEGMKTELEQLGCRKPITVLSIWASASEFKPVVEDKEPHLLYSGNFGKKQNLDQLFPLIKRLSEEDAPIGVHLRGEGGERFRLEEKAKEEDIKNVTFLPLAPSNQFLEVLQAANIHLVPQALNVANYALPSKLFSIMAAGRPYICIAEETSPLNQLAEDSGAGICVRPGDEEALYREVSSLASDKKRQNEMGQNAIRYVSENMNREKIFEAYNQLLEI